MERERVERETRGKRNAWKENAWKENAWKENAWKEKRVERERVEKRTRGKRTRGKKKRVERERVERERLDIKEDYRIQEGRRINEILNSLQQKIGAINQHNSKAALTAANILLQGLKVAQQEYDLTLGDSNTNPYRAFSAFQSKCIPLIYDAKIEFEIDLPWIKYLNNLLRIIGNGVIYAVTFGHKSCFFPLEESDSTKAVTGLVS